jgi:inner membrane protein
LDSLSQAVLGSAVAVIATGGKSPRKAMIYGALIATLPDLDVLQSFDNDVEATIQHRTWSHSWIVHLFAAPLIALLLFRLDRSYSFIRWWLTTFLLLSTHAALDAFTIYGTGLFWPFNLTPVMGGSVFIIDPLYTLPLAVSWILCWKNKRPERTVSLMSWGLVLSCVYLGWGQLAQQHVEAHARETMEQQGMSFQNIVATPSPFNSVLWRIIALDDDQFHEGFYHFLEGPQKLKMTSFPRNLALQKEIPGTTGFSEFTRFNHNYYALSKRDNTVIASDLRMGVEPFYFFQFVFAEGEGVNGNAVPRFARLPVDEIRLFRWLGRRLIGREVESLNEFLENSG